ncbi:phage major capsid protein [Brevundimonas pondensis]|uniref:Phage major capsid protein n=1 Tax=Brevundimonas pondensis TaxID=2774189 RepID=A0ABX7SKH4_9CAUL|nr:phage major capsid protein [Brevundimonas pondensis]QTC88182.1 phage major capsid protein [Brevundimonas pondensis]
MKTHLMGAAPRALCGAVRAEGPISSSDVKAAIEKVNAAFEEFKKTNDDNSKKADTVLSEKLDKINAAIDEGQKVIDDHAKQIAALKLNGAGDDNVIGEIKRDPEYVGAFRAHMRKGEVQAALNKGADAEGGFLAPVEWDRTITGKLKESSPVRENATVMTISTAGFRKVFTDRAVGSGWVGETAARPATGTPGFNALDFIPGELYANPQATQQMLDDSAVDLEAWLASEVEDEFSRQENIAFLSGDGANKPFGLLTYVTGAANAAKHPFGAIKLKNSGTAAAMDKSDALIDLIYDLPAKFRANAKFYMNRLTQGTARKLKDGDGNYLWQPSYQLGQPVTLAGHELVELPDMPDIAANAISALFGDMKATYLVVDRLGIRVIRDNLTNKPYVGFYTVKRVGGGVQNPEAMRGFKIAV